MTNAPGHRQIQQISRSLPGYKVSDADVAIDAVQLQLQDQRYNRVVPGGINGFCMVARTADWWAGAFSTDAVFNPIKKMTGNEDELQRRWEAKKMRMASARNSFVFHYRSVSRVSSPSGPNAQGRYRAR